jgi:hypothetical protein
MTAQDFTVGMTVRCNEAWQWTYAVPVGTEGIVRGVEGSYVLVEWPMRVAGRAAVHMLPEELTMAEKVLPTTVRVVALTPDLQDFLERVLDFLVDHEDVTDSPDGGTHPNEAMRLATEFERWFPEETARVRFGGLR